MDELLIIGYIIVYFILCSFSVYFQMDMIKHVKKEERQEALEYVHSSLIPFLWTIISPITIWFDIRGYFIRQLDETD